MMVERTGLERIFSPIDARSRRPVLEVHTQYPSGSKRRSHSATIIQSGTQSAHLSMVILSTTCKTAHKIAARRFLSLDSLPLLFAPRKALRMVWKTFAVALGPVKTAP